MAGVDAAVLSLIRDLSSVAELELLLFLEQHRQRDWSVPELSLVLRSSRLSIDPRLERLVSRSLVRCAASPSGPRYSYDPGLPEVEAAVSRTATVYSERPHWVVGQIYSRDRAV